MALSIQLSKNDPSPATPSLRFRRGLAAAGKTLLYQTPATPVKRSGPVFLRPASKRQGNPQCYAISAVGVKQNQPRFLRSSAQPSPAQTLRPILPVLASRGAILLDRWPKSFYIKDLCVCQAPAPPFFAPGSILLNEPSPSPWRGACPPLGSGTKLGHLTRFPDDVNRGFAIIFKFPPDRRRVDGNTSVKGFQPIGP